MANIGTYTSSYSPYIPSKILPEQGDMLTFDWMESISQFSQKFLKIATVQINIANNTTYNFDYSSLRCDEHPPFIKAYIKDSTSGWLDYNELLNYPVNNQYYNILNVGLGTCDIFNFIGSAQDFLLIAYL